MRMLGVKFADFVARQDGISLARELVNALIALHSNDADKVHYPFQSLMSWFTEPCLRFSFVIR